MSGTKKPGCFQPGFFVSRLVGREDSQSTHKALFLFDITVTMLNLYPQRYPQTGLAGPMTKSVLYTRRPNVHAGRLGQRIGRPSPPATICTVSILPPTLAYTAKSPPQISSRVVTGIKPSAPHQPLSHFSIFQQVAKLVDCKKAQGQTLGFWGSHSAYLVVGLRANPQFDVKF